MADGSGNSRQHDATTALRRIYFENAFEQQNQISNRFGKPGLAIWRLVCHQLEIDRQTSQPIMLQNPSLQPEWTGISC